MAEVSREYRLVHEHEGSFLASKNRCWPWTIYVYRASTDDEVKIVIESLWNCPINCDYYSILGVKIFKEVGGKEVCDSCQCEAIVTISKRVLLRINIELAHAICPYNVNEWEFMASLRTQRIVRLPFSFVWWRIHSS